MNDRSWRVVYLVIAVGGAVTAALVSAAPVGLGDPQGRWLEIVVVLSVSALVFEPFFSGGGPAVANSLLAILGGIGIGLDEPVLPTLLIAVASASLLLLLAAFVLKGQSTTEGQARVAAVLQKLGTTMGGWRFLLTITLVVSLVVNNSPFGEPWIISAATVLFLLAVTKVPPHELVNELRGEHTSRNLHAVRLFPPQEIVIGGAGILALSPGDLVSVEGSGTTSVGVLIGPTVYDGRAAARVFTPDVTSALAEADVTKVSVTLGAAGDRVPAVERAVAELSASGTSIHGTIIEKSSIEQLRVELLPERDVEVGDLLWTPRVNGRLLAGL